MELFCFVSTYLLDALIDTHTARIDFVAEGVTGLGYPAYLMTILGVAKLLGVPYMIENPVSVVSTYWRKPDYIFHTAALHV